MMPLRMGLQVDYGLPLSPTQIVPDKNKELKISCRIDWKGILEEHPILWKIMGTISASFL